eukprot:gene30406-39648_t
MNFHITRDGLLYSIEASHSSWSDLYIRNIHNIDSTHGSLENLVVAIFSSFEFRFLNIENLFKVVTKIKSKYNANPYHNFEHACHVLLNCGYFLTVLGESVSELDKISLLYAAFIHDVEHLGVPNISLIRKSHELAIQYHDQSVAEMNSLAVGLQLLQESDTDIFLELPQSERTQFRQNVIELVLSTDIADAYRRKRTLARVEELSTGPQGNLDASSDVGRLVLLSLVLRAADIGSSYQNFATSKIWAQRYYTESNAWLLSEGKPIATHEFFYKDQIIHLQNYVGSLLETAKKTRCLDDTLVATMESNFRANLDGWKEEGNELLDKWEHDFRIAYNLN